MVRIIAKRITSLILCAFLVFPVFASVTAFAMTDAETVQADLDILNASIQDAAGNVVTSGGILSAPLADDNGTKYLLDSLHLPKAGTNGSTITWSSTDESAIGTDGTVIRALDENKEVTLTATVTMGDTAQNSNPMTFSIPSLESQISAVPKLGALKSLNDFNGDISDDSYAVPIYGTSISDGILTVMQDSAKSTGMDFYINSDKSNANEAFYTEFVLKKKERGTKINIRFIDADLAKYPLDVSWGWSGIAIADKESAEAGKTFFPTPYDDKNFLPPFDKLSKECRLGIYVDPVAKTYEVWVNHVKLFDEPRHLRDVTSPIKKIRMYMDTGTANQYFTMDSYRIYSVPKSDESCVSEDLSLLTKESLLSAPFAVDDGNEYLLDSLHLPQLGGNGSTIEWSSTDEAVISSEGTVIRPYDDSTEVTLTAKATKGDAAESKEFVFTVPSLKAQISSVPKLADMTAFDDFEGDSLKDSNMVEMRGVSVDNSRMTVTENPSLAAGVDLYINNDKTIVQDPFYTEMVLSKKDRGTGVVMRFIDSNLGVYPLDISWGWSGIAITDKESTEAGKTFFPTPYDNKGFLASFENIDKECRLGVYVDPAAKTYEVWVNNIKLFDTPRHLKDVDSGIKKIEIYMNQGTSGRWFSMDSYRVHSIWKDMSDDARVKADAATITDTLILAKNEIGNNIVETNLNLPIRGKNGSDITWSSSDASVIAADGIVTRKPGTDADRITLTATVSYGSAEPIEKQFILKVLQKDCEIRLLPDVSNLRWEDDFDDEASNAKNMQYDTADTFTKRKWEDSKYIVTRDQATIDAGHNSYTYLHASKNGYAQDYHSGIIGMEFTLGREGNVGVMTHLRSNTSKIYVSITWSYNGDVVFTCRENANSTATQNARISGAAKGDTVKITLLMDTVHGTFDAWVNDKLCVENKGTRETGATNFQSMMLYYDGTTPGTWWMEHWKVYDAILPDSKKVDYDANSITIDSIVTEPIVYENYVNSDFNLICDVPYGSEITWSCDRPDIVDVSTGKLTKPSDMTEDTPIKLTAHVVNGLFERDVTFDFMIVRRGDSEDTRANADAEFFTDSMITTQPFDEIREALNLISKGPLFGTEIVWTSSDPQAITTAGRVIRPRWDEAARNVTLTATIGGKITKTYNFTVVPDDYIGDPMATSDEDFFGVWDGSTWTTKPQFKYESFPDMSKVEAAAKAGDYTKAKEELLSYMRNKYNGKRPGVGRNATLAEYMLNGGSETGHTNFWAATGSAESSEYTQIEVPLSVHGISAGYEKSFALISKYRDSVELSVAGTNYPDAKMRPVLMLYVNGSPRYYQATESAVIRAGDYKTKSLGSPAELKVKMFGPLLGDETYRTLLKFDFTDIAEGDTIGSASLMLYVKKSDNYSEPKEFYVMKEPDVAWKADTFNWMSLNGLYYNFNGIDGLNNWNPQAGSDIEYRYQSIRFQKFPAVAAEYIYTGDEKYAYSVIYNMMDFLVSKEPTYIRTLDSNIRLRQWIELYRLVLESKYMTPDIHTAMVKRLYASLTAHADDTTSTANATITKFQSVILASTVLTEYTDSNRCRQKAIDFFDEDINNYFFSDGAYKEDTGGYLWVSFTEYVKVKELMETNGIKPSENFDNIVHNGAYYDLLLRGPGGEYLGYGDEAARGTNAFNRYTNIATYYNDRELQYLDTQGSKGEQPAWTSRLFPESSYVFMRSDWSDKAQYLFTNARNGEFKHHAHADDNSIILFGYGKNLLTDAGYVTYSTGPDRAAAASTLMHNTVQINEVNQSNVAIDGDYDKGVGTVDAFTANENFDMSSLTSKGYEHIGNKHKRTITFVKPDFYIVSDLMTPTDKNEVNTYKQSWHMTPESGLEIKDNKLYSAYPDSGNIIIAEADETVPTEAIGVYTVSYGGVGSAPYAYYTKQEKGDTTFDTVLMPYKGKSSELDTERIDMGVDTSEATALKITMDKDGEKSTVYYMLEYKDNGDRTFGKYITDAQMAVVVEDSKGNIKEIILNNGSYVKSTDGSINADFNDTIADASLVISGTELEISTTDENADISKSEIKLKSDIETVRVNGQLKEIDAAGGVIKPTDTDKEEILENDKNPGTGIIDKPSTGGNGSTGGTGGGMGGTGGAVTPVIPDTKLPFTDISGHWASDNVVSANASGIINGYPDATFKPDNDITRAEFLTVVCRGINLEPKAYNGEFADVSSSDWYASTIASALDAGIISKDINFRPNDSITRQEMCKILAIALKLNRNMGIVPADYVPSYTDTDAVSDWATEYVTFVSYFKIMTGMTDGSFAPLKNATRAEAATVLTRSLDK